MLFYEDNKYTPFKSTVSKPTVSQFLNLFCVEMYNPSH